MSLEIERKFLVKDQSYRKLASGILYRQGYLCTNPTVRVRTAGNRGYLTIKGPSSDISRTEYEYEIPLIDANALLHDLCLKPLIEKIRYTFEFKGLVWEIDEFLQENQGLIVAEIELESQDQVFEKPDFIGCKVSDDPRYRNSNLIKHPYQSW